MTDPDPEKCDRPPAGWTCSRPAGHDGPCAATGPKFNMAAVLHAKSLLEATDPNPPLFGIEGHPASLALLRKKNEGKALPPTLENPDMREDFFITYHSAHLWEKRKQEAEGLESLIVPMAEIIGSYYGQETEDKYRAATTYADRLKVVIEAIRNKKP